MNIFEYMEMSKEAQKVPNPGLVRRLIDAVTGKSSKEIAKLTEENARHMVHKDKYSQMVKALKEGKGLTWGKALGAGALVGGGAIAGAAGSRAKRRKQEEKESEMGA